MSDEPQPPQPAIPGEVCQCRCCGPLGYHHHSAVEWHRTSIMHAEKIVQLEAQCAAISAEYERLRADLKGINGASGPYERTAAEFEARYPKCASDAGKRLLERLERAEWRVQQVLGSDNSRDAIRAKALEEAAMVAEAYEPECESCPRGVASAIRALKERP